MGLSSYSKKDKESESGYSKTSKEAIEVIQAEDDCSLGQNGGGDGQKWLNEMMLLTVIVGVGVMKRSVPNYVLSCFAHIFLT